MQNIVIERYAQRLAAPKAHAVSPRSFEIFRQFGLDTKEIRNLGSPRNDAYWVNFVTTLSGERIGKLEYERMDAKVLEATPEMIHNIPQPTLEQVFTDELEKSDLVEISRNVSFVSLRRDCTDGKVITTVEDRSSGRQYDISSQHVIACDGRKSEVREFLEIESDGEHSVEAMMTIHFNADIRPVVGDNVGILHWIFDPEVSGFIIGYDLGGNLVLIHNFDEKKRPIEQWNEEHCREVVDKAIGKNISYDILSFRPWILSRKIAKNYRCGDVFLAGDAAHSFPPNGGLGLNSGIADVHNLAYKIAAVHKGWATDKFLDSYEAERRPIAEVNARQSVKNGKQIFSLLKALGTAGIDDPEKARANLFSTIRDPAKQDEIQANIEAQREHFDNLELHIGYVYGSDKVPTSASSFTPKYVPGARLPHAWIRPSKEMSETLHRPLDVSYVSELSAQDCACRKYSTLDLCAKDGFTVITGFESEDWKAKANEIRSIIQMGSPPLYFCQLGGDFTMTDNTPYSEQWVHSLRLDKGSAVVVRPDQHILCILDRGDATSALLEELNSHLVG